MFEPRQSRFWRVHVVKLGGGCEESTGKCFVLSDLES